MNATPELLRGTPSPLLSSRQRPAVGAAITKPFVVVVQIGPSREPLMNKGRAIVWPVEWFEQAMAKAAAVGELDTLVPMDEWTGPTVDARTIARTVRRTVEHVDERMLDKTGGLIR